MQIDLQFIKYQAYLRHPKGLFNIAIVSQFVEQVLQRQLQLLGMEITAQITAPLEAKIDVFEKQIMSQDKFFQDFYRDLKHYEQFYKLPPEITARLQTPFLTQSDIESLKDHKRFPFTKSGVIQKPVTGTLDAQFFTADSTILRFCSFKYLTRVGKGEYDIDFKDLIPQDQRFRQYAIPNKRDNQGGLITTNPILAKPIETMQDLFLALEFWEVAIVSVTPHRYWEIKEYRRWLILRNKRYKLSAMIKIDKALREWMAMHPDADWCIHSNKLSTVYKEVKGTILASEKYENDNRFAQAGTSSAAATTGCSSNQNSRRQGQISNQSSSSSSSTQSRPRQANTQPPRQSAPRAAGGASAREICRNYNGVNGKRCTRPDCPYEHKCLNCRSAHPQYACSFSSRYQ